MKGKPHVALTRQQARDFAQQILPGLKAYLATHQDEYRRWLAAQKGKV